MSPVVIVAIPRDDDVVWKISSEKVPHMTICNLGELNPSMDIAAITAYVEHVANTAFRAFGVFVEKRGVLGDKQADVLFFDKDFSHNLFAEMQAKFRANDDIEKAYLATEQFPDYTPHLTLGYPETPAFLIPDNAGRLDFVSFDRIALWTGNYEGPTFDLQTTDMMMTDSVESVIAHFGTKGMRWGVRKASRTVPTSDNGGQTNITYDPAKTKISIDSKTNKVTATSTSSRDLKRVNKQIARRPSTDAQKAIETQAKIKKGTVRSLSNKELQDLVTRLNLERQLANLQPPSKKQVAAKIVKDVLIGVGKQQVQKIATDVTNKQVSKVTSKVTSK